MPTQSVSWIGAAGTASWQSTSNWSTSVLPGAGDTVYLVQGTSDITGGLNNATVALAKMIVNDGFTGTVGVAGDSGAYLQIDPTLLLIYGSGQRGFTRFKLHNSTSTDVTIVVDSTGGSADDGRSAFQFKGGTTSSKLFVTAGSVDVAIKPGETASLAEIGMAGGTLSTGSGLVIVALNQDDGILATYGGVTTLTQNGGSLSTFGTAIITTARVNGIANFNHRPTSGNTFTDLTIDGNGQVDFRGDPRQVTIANTATLYSGARINSFNKAQLKTGTNNFTFIVPDGEIEDVTLNTGIGPTVTIG